MKSNELRIGNWVTGSSNDVYQRPFQVTVRDFTLPDFIGNVAPIPITPEILEKAGFRQMVIDGKKKWKIEPNDSFYLYGHDNTGFYSPYVMPEVQYLHQLQNLYFALTGEELPIEL